MKESNNQKIGFIKSNHIASYIHIIANKFPASNEILSKRFQYDVSKKDIKNAGTSNRVVH